jgi:hypothetical protein
MHDHLGLGGSHRLGDRVGVKSVGHNRPRSQAAHRIFETTNRLRAEGTDHLLAAARAVGARRFVAQSYAGWTARTGEPVKGEDAPLDPDPPETVRGLVDAIRHLEEAVTGAGWQASLSGAYALLLPR